MQIAWYISHVWQVFINLTWSEDMRFFSPFINITNLRHMWKKSYLLIKICNLVLIQPCNPSVSVYLCLNFVLIHVYLYWIFFMISIFIYLCFHLVYCCKIWYSHCNGGVFVGINDSNSNVGFPIIYILLDELWNI